MKIWLSKAPGQLHTQEQSGGREGAVAATLVRHKAKELSITSFYYVSNKINQKCSQDLSGPKNRSM